MHLLDIIFSSHVLWGTLYTVPMGHTVYCTYGTHCILYLWDTLYTVPMVVVDFPSPKGVGVIPATTIYFPFFLKTKLF